MIVALQRAKPANPPRNTRVISSGFSLLPNTCRMTIAYKLVFYSEWNKELVGEIRKEKCENVIHYTGL